MTNAREHEWIAIEIVAQCYEVEIAWLVHVADLGVVVGIEQHGDHLRVAATELDRIAEVVRWHRHLGVDLETIATLLLRES